MSETPVQKLEAAIAEFVREGMKDEGILSGWVLGYQTTEITDDERLMPIGDHFDYTMGTGTTMPLGVGLARLLQVRLEAIHLDPNKYAFGGDDDES